ncbi:hypothetical protein BaRGS_00029767, partial [Batillaria attramentaria]
WLNPLFKKGRTQELETEDMYNVCPEDSSGKLGTDLEQEWMKELKKREESGGRVKPSLLKALFRLFGLRYMLLGIIVFSEEAVRVVQPLLLGGLIRYFTPNSTTSITEVYLYAMGVSLCAILLAVAHHPYFFGVTRMGMQMRVACCSLMYKKALRLSNSAMGQTTVGQIVNLMSNDVNRFDQAVIFLHFLWIGPLQAIAVLVILWHELGPSVLAGFAVLILLIPVQGTMGKLFSKLRRKTAVHTDERVKVMNEIIAGMRVIKMYCWEKPFGEIVEKIRSQEIERIRYARFTQALILAPNFFSVKLILLLTFLAFTLSQGAMTPEHVFVTISLYQAIRVPITVFMPFAVQNIAEMRISFDRVQHLLYLIPILALYIVSGQPLLPPALFKAMMLYGYVNKAVVGFMTIAVQRLFEMFPTLDRIQHLLYLIPILALYVVSGQPLLPPALFKAMILYGYVNKAIVEFMTIAVQRLFEMFPTLDRIQHVLCVLAIRVHHVISGQPLPAPALFQSEVQVIRTKYNKESFFGELWELTPKVVLLAVVVVWFLQSRWTLLVPSNLYRFVAYVLALNENLTYPVTRGTQWFAEALPVVSRVEVRQVDGGDVDTHDL